MNLHRYLHPFLRWGAFSLYWMMGGYRVEGARNIPRSGAALVACNHVSLADPVAMLGASPRALHYMAARELHEIPLLGSLIRFLQAFPVRRGQHDPEALSRCRSLLRAGEAVVIFPEGRCSPDGRLGPLLPGVAALALREGCPIVPAVVSGTEGMLPLGARRLHCYPKLMRFGPPLELGRLARGIPVRQQVDSAMHSLRQALLELGATPAEADLPHQGSGQRCQTRS